MAYVASLLKRGEGAELDFAKWKKEFETNVLSQFLVVPCVLHATAHVISSTWFDNKSMVQTFVSLKRA